MIQKRYIVDGYDPRYGRFHFETESLREARAKAELYSKYSEALVEIEDLDNGRRELYKNGYPFDAIP